MELLLGASVSEELPSEDYRLPGTGPVPRLRRALHFPSDASPSTPAVDRTFTDPPLPPVPPSALNDPVIAGTINRAPHLFGVSTPFRPRAVDALLRFHPNRPLVDSVVHGLTHGFWPAFDGDLDHSTHGPPPVPLSEEDNEFIAAQLAKDFEKGYLSEPSTTLLPGMVVSPMFVVRLEGRKPRAVVDQSASGLNSGVAREVARVTYDTIAELGRLMRYRRRRGEDTGSKSSSGLGFWWVPEPGASRTTAYSRISPPLDDIMLAEGLAVHSAIAAALASGLVRARLLVCTYSAPCVYAFDAGRGHERLLGLVRDSYDTLSSAGVDLRVRHVQGDRNATADALSRQTPAVLHRWFHNLSHFTPSPAALALAAVPRAGATR